MRPSDHTPIAASIPYLIGSLAKPQTARQGSDMTQIRAAFTYAVDRAERVTEPRHQHYQVRLRAHLEGRVSDLTGNMISSTCSSSSPLNALLARLR
jgi:hypothetical protein